MFSNILFDNIIWVRNDFCKCKSKAVLRICLKTNEMQKLSQKGRKMDRRKIKTKKAITEAFNTLITKKRYEKISIQNIIDEADVGRSTFYEHFGTKDDLLRSRCHELFEHIFSQNDEKTTNHEFSNCPFDPLSKEFINANALKKIFTHIYITFCKRRK